MADELTPSERKLLDAWEPMLPPPGFVTRVAAARGNGRRAAYAAVAAACVACAAIVVVIIRPEPERSVMPELPAVALYVDAGPLVPHMDGPSAITPGPAPDTVDIVLVAGEETATIHDPTGDTMVRFAFAGQCSGDGTVEIDTHPGFKNPRSASGAGIADLRLSPGGYSYRVLCDGASSPVRMGRVVMRKDGATRTLPRDPPINPLRADGRRFTISYQSLIPSLELELDAPDTLHLATGGDVRTFTSTGTSVVVPRAQLAPTTYTYWVAKKPDVVSTLIIRFDHTAPQVYIERPPDGGGRGVWAPPIAVRGVAAPGWSVSIEGVDVPVQNGQFATSVMPPATRALPLRLVHPERGAHYYLRRP